ncbi:MAG: ThuA domain-containing protein, partial [Planctomycetota bacterium]
MLRLAPTLIFTTLLAGSVFADHHEGDQAADEQGKIRVLMMTGQNNHDWKKTTPALVEIINATGEFELTVDEKPWELSPNSFDQCDVVFSNWSMWPNLEQDPWSPEVKQAFLDYMQQGGGLVVMHAGSSIHYQWSEFQALVGKTWINGTTWHGAKHEFEVSMTGNHPIIDGIGPFRIFDELWRGMVPTGECTVLATADTSGDEKPGPSAPMLMTTRLGEGRGVNLVLGHDTRSIANPHFQQLLVRSLEWAATGEVTITS